MPLDPDYNNFDAFHAASPHPRMSAGEWPRAFRDAWTEFYSFDQMRPSLLPQNPHTYWGVLKTLIWYRAGMIEGAHPMITGFFRLKDRTSRRPRFPIERRWPFFRRRIREVTHLLREYVAIYFEMQELWLQTRIRREDYRFLGDLRKLAPTSVRELKLAWGRVHAAAALKLTTLQGRLGEGVGGFSATMTERLEIVREAVGSRTASLAALKFPTLPPAPRASGLWRRIRRVNPLSLDRLEYNPALEAVLARRPWRRPQAEAVAPQPAEAGLESRFGRPRDARVPRGDARRAVSTAIANTPTRTSGGTSSTGRRPVVVRILLPHERLLPFVPFQQRRQLSRPLDQGDVRS